MYGVSCLSLGLSLSLGLNLNSNINSNMIRYGFTDTWYTFLTHSGWVTHICVTKLTITGSGNGLSPGRRQPIFWTKAEILWHFNRNSNTSLKKMHLKMSSEKYRLLSLGLNVWNCHLPMAIIWYNKLFTYALNLTMCLAVILHISSHQPHKYNKISTVGCGIR